MKITSLPLSLRALAATAVCALLTAAALAQTPAAPAAPGAAPAATPPPKPLSPTEKNFIKNAGKSLYYQIQLATAAKTAFTEATDPKVRLRDSTIKDLNKAFEALSKIAQANGETLPTELSGGDKSGIERLGKMKDEKFAKQWLEELSKESKKLEKDFESAGKNLQNVELKSYATNYYQMVHNVFTSSEAAEKALKKK